MDPVAAFLSAHNADRAAVQPAASPALPALAWDAQLAARTASWAGGCADTDHDGLLDPDPNRAAGYSGTVGENFFASTAAIVPRDAVDHWFGDAQFYNYAANTCGGSAYNTNNAGWMQCAPYTQLVDRGTTKVGCSLVHCPALTFAWGALCYYSPAGNNADVSGNLPRPY